MNRGGECCCFSNSCGFLASSVSLVDRLQQEVREKEAELKQERQRLLELSRTEAELGALLQGEAARARGAEGGVQELKEQLAASTTRCVELEGAKTSLEAELRAGEARHQAALQAVQGEAQQEREERAAASDGLVEAEKRLAALAEELAAERSKCLGLEAAAAERLDE